MAHHSLRRAQAADTEAVLHIQKEAMLPHVVAQYGAWNELERQKRFRAEDILEHDMIEVDGRVAGCVWVRRSPAHHEVVRLYLLAAFQNQGIGSAVLRSIMREAESLGLPVRLRVLRANPAKHLYERMGFTVCDATETHYDMQYSRAPEIYPAKT